MQQTCNIWIEKNKNVKKQDIKQYKFLCTWNNAWIISTHNLQS